MPIAISGPNAILAVFAVAVLAIGIGFLWRPGEPPILLFIFFFQWMQSATAALYGNMIGLPLSELMYSPGRHDLASGLMLMGVLVLMLAMRAAAGETMYDLNTQIKALVGAHPFGYWVRIYAVTWIFSLTCQTIAPLTGGFYQPIITIAGVKWAAFVLLTFAAFALPNGASRATWLAIFTLEFMLSIGGFFASFKQVFFFALFGLIGSNVRFGLRLIVPGALLAVTMIGLGVIWTSIKGEYRAFVNSGTGQQVLLVDYGERVDELGRLVGELDWQALEAAGGDFVGRLMYNHYFGSVAANVPSTLPHTNGEIWGEAISRPFMPRLFFPDKRAINDSDLTNQYTGLNVAGKDQGTSISIGFMGEAYIDFGPVFMFAAIAALGGVIGLFYRWLLKRPGPMAAIGAALAPFALMPAHLAETSILKMIPSLILMLLACMAVLWVLVPITLGRPDRPTLQRH